MQYSFTHEIKAFLNCILLVIFVKKFKLIKFWDLIVANIFLSLAYFLLMLIIVLVNFIWHLVKFEKIIFIVLNPLSILFLGILIDFFINQSKILIRDGILFPFNYIFRSQRNYLTLKLLLIITDLKFWALQGFWIISHRFIFLVFKIKIFLRKIYAVHFFFIEIKA